jgi:hypothetical protein
MTSAPSARPTAIRPPAKEHRIAGPSPSFEIRERSQSPNSLILRHSAPEFGRDTMRSRCPQQAEARLRGMGSVGLGEKGTLEVYGY